MKIKACILWITLGAATLLAFEYRIKTVKLLPMESYPAKAELSGVTIAADPYGDNEKSYSAFDVKDLNARGYYPVHVIIKNGSSKFYNIRTRNIVLVTSVGQQLYTTPATVLVDDVIKSGLTGKMPLLKKEKDATKVGSPLYDFTTKELTNRSIDPDSVVDGFLFFYTPNPNKEFFTDSTLFIPKLEEEGNLRPIGPFSIPLNPALKTQ